MKGKTKLFGAASLLVFMLGIVGIGFRSYPVKADENSIDFWTTYATEKVLQQQTGYGAGVRREARVSVQACQGEYESAQLMMTARSDIKSVVVSAGDLTAAGGDVFSGENVRLEFELYAEVKKNFTGNGAPVGRYPDALVPMENIVRAGENRIASGNNQGVYVTFKVPYEQPAGLYQGHLVVDYDGASRQIPVELTVYDLKVNRETHSKSKFNLGFSGFLAELDNTQEMHEAYVKKMIEHRVAVSSVLYDAHLVGNNTDSMRKYVDKAYEYCIEQGMSNFNIPAITATDPTTKDKTINAQKLTEYIVQVVVKSLETGDNLMERAIFSTGLIDEPDLFGLVNRVPSVIHNFDQAKRDAAAQVAALLPGYDVSSEYAREILDSIEKFRIVVTMPYNESVSDLVETWCPLASEYDTPEKRALYDEQDEKWWYTCINPRPPYPGYQIEDTLLSARSLSWMMSEYDVKGNLYWAVDVNAKYDGVAYQFIEDYYGETERYPKANGDGFLFYPGNKYGVFGPLNSIRFEAIRDGNEEYELFYNLIANYRALGYSEDAIIRNINSLVYTGTKVGTTSEKFYEARRALIQLCMLADSKAGVAVVGAEDDNFGNVTYRIFSKSGYPVMVDGSPAEVTENVPNGRIYTVKTKLTEEKNQISFTVTVDGVEREFSLDLGGKAEIYDGEALAGGFTAAGAAVTAESVPGSEIGRDGSVVKLSVAATTDKHQSVKWANATLSNIIDSGTNKAVFRVFNPSDSAIPFKIHAKYSGEKLNIELLSVTLAPGENEIVLTGVGAYNWSKIGSLESLTLYFNRTNIGVSDAKVLYITNVISYKR